MKYQDLLTAYEKARSDRYRYDESALKFMKALGSEMAQTMGLSLWQRNPLGEHVLDPAPVPDAQGNITWAPVIAFADGARIVLDIKVERAVSGGFLVKSMGHSKVMTEDDVMNHAEFYDAIMTSCVQLITNRYGPPPAVEK